MASETRRWPFLFAVLAVLAGGYFLGLKLLPSPPLHSAPASFEGDLWWSLMEGTAEKRVEPLSVIDLLLAHRSMGIGARSCLRLAELEEHEPRKIRRQLRVLLRGASISKSWSADALSRAVLDRSFYGRGAVGFEGAAQAYFQLPASSLSPAQKTLLVERLWLGSSFDPACPRRSRLQLPAGSPSAEELASASASAIPPPGGCLSKNRGGTGNFGPDP